MQKRIGTALSQPAAPPSREPHGSAASERPPPRAAGPAAAGWGKQRRARTPLLASAATSSSASLLTSGTLTPEVSPRCLHSGGSLPAGQGRTFSRPRCRPALLGERTYIHQTERTPPSAPEPPARRSARLRSAPPGGNPGPAGSVPAPTRRLQSCAGQAGGLTAAPPGGSGGMGAPGGPRRGGDRGVLLPRTPGHRRPSVREEKDSQPA